MAIILGIVFFWVALYLDVKSDLKRIDTNSINHTRGAIIRAVALIPSFLCFYIPLDNIQWWYLILKAVTVFMMMASVWWEFFDGILNKYRKKSWRYNGSDDPDDPKSDKFLKKLSPSQQGILKWSLIIIFITLYNIFIWG